MRRHGNGALLRVGLELPIAVLPRPLPHPTPLTHCSGCDHRFASGEACLVDRGEAGRRRITYCFACRDAGWPCEHFQEVLHP